MKHLPLGREAHRAVHASFSRYLAATGYVATTCAMVEACVREFLHVLEGQDPGFLAEVGPEHVLDYHAHLMRRPRARGGGGLSSLMIGHHLFALRTFFAWLVRTGGLECDPMTRLVFPKGVAAPRCPLSREQVKGLFTASRNATDRAILILLYGCGMRRSEATGLDRSDVDLVHGKLVIRLGKYSKRRALPLSPQLLVGLARYCRSEPQRILARTKGADQAPFLLLPTGKRMTGDALNRRLKALARTAGITERVFPHRLRHSIATHLKENGMPVRMIQQFLGHASYEATEVYLSGQRMRWRRAVPFRKRVHQFGLHGDL
jgi:integrase/recombinase XerD